MTTFKQVVPLLMAGYVIWQWNTWWRQRQTRVAGQPVEETTWEGEGGALPDTGAQLGPEPHRQ